MRLPSGLKTAEPVERTVGSFAVTTPVRTSQTQVWPVAKTAPTRRRPSELKETCETAMRIGDSLPHWLQNVAAVLWIIGLGLNFVAAISPIWGWSSVLGWVSSAVLVAFAVDERKGIRASLAGNEIGR